MQSIATTNGVQGKVISAGLAGRLRTLVFIAIAVSAALIVALARLSPWEQARGADARESHLTSTLAAMGLPRPAAANAPSRRESGSSRDTLDTMASQLEAEQLLRRARFEAAAGDSGSGGSGVPPASALPMVSVLSLSRGEPFADENTLANTLYQTYPQHLREPGWQGQQARVRRRPAPRVGATTTPTRTRAHTLALPLGKR